jgi:uncharacterized protein
MKKKPEKITVDTNILISSFVFPGKTVVRLIDRIIAGAVAMGISPDILKEFARVCLLKLRFEPAKTMEAVAEIQKNSEMVFPLERIDVLDDEPDNRILECAAAFGADCIISGDKHLLQLKKYGKIEILSPAEYIRKYW